MRIEEAIDIIKSECYVFNPLNFDRSTMVNTALDMAVKALEQEPCEDCISKTQALSDYADWYGFGYRDNTFYNHLKNMPSIQPKTDVLDKMRAEIDSYCSDNRDRNDGLYIAMQIIDKYKAESEEQKMQNKQLECASCEYSGKIPEYRDCPGAYTEVAVHCKKYQDITKRKESNNAIRNRN